MPAGAAQPAPVRQDAIRRAYTSGWAWGVVCGLCWGVCTTALAVVLWHMVQAGLRCPAC